MTHSTDALTRLGIKAFAKFLADVQQHDLVVQCRNDYAQQATNVGHDPVFRTVSSSTAGSGRWKVKVDREHPDYVDCNIYFEILCYGAFCLSVAAVPRLTTRRFIFGKSYDRPSWAAYHEGIAERLYAEIARLDERYPAQSHDAAIAGPVAAAKLAFIGYMQHFTNYEAGADLLALMRRAHSSERLGSVLFSNRLSHAIDPVLGELHRAFNNQWLPFAQQIIKWADDIVKVEFDAA